MKRILVSAMIFLSPIMVLAQAFTPNQGISGLFDFAGGVLNRVVPLIISLAVVWFIYNVFKYAVAGDEDKKAEAKKHMIWGIVGIFVMVSVWGLVAILQTTFGTSGVQGTIGNQLPRI